MPASAPRPVDNALHITEGLLDGTDEYDILGLLTGEEQEEVLSFSRIEVFSPGQHVFMQGEPHDGIFLIRSGRVRTFYVGRSGRVITLAHWTAGHFVGGPEIFGGGVHMWSAVALRRSEIAFLPAPCLRSLMSRFPNFAIGLVQGLVYKGKCYSALLQVLGTLSASSRLANLLLMLAERGSASGESNAACVRGFSHAELANMVGTTRQWVTASLKRFEKANLISCRERELVIVDKPGLERLCD